GTINAWTPYAYDWRLPLQRTLAEGSEQFDSSTQLKLVDEIERLANDSKSGKVTIVAHSMGGLLGKLLIQKLEAEGKAHLIESFVMVGTPQLGTPQAAATLLHGHQTLAMDLFSRSHVTRAIGQDMETAYSLLPSERYFSEVVDPVLKFSESAAFTEVWRNRWGATTDTYGEFSEFMTGTGVLRVSPEPTNLAIPEVVRSDLLSNADALHDLLDSYVFPAHIRVVQIAGWGLPTLKGLEYKNKHLVFQGYEADFTVEGDQTVVYPSAVSSNTSEKYYFNLPAYNALPDTSNHEHRNLIGAGPIQTLVSSIITNEAVQNEYISVQKPDPGNLEDQLLVSTKSPVILGAYDMSGNFTGINPNQDLTAETLPIEEGIPESTFIASGEDFYLFLPKSGKYDFVFKGTGTGPATLEVGTFSNDAVIPEVSYTDIPVTPSTTADFVIDTAVVDTVFIEIDSNGDGQGDSVVAPDGYVPPPTLSELIASLKATIESLDIKEKLREKLLKRVEKIEKKIAKQKSEKASQVIMNLEKKVIKKTEKGRISSADAEAILNLLEQIEGEL
ncbi:MAG: hypothetical protein WBK28_00135, partial [Minisyncoccia bacterium]